MPSITINQNNTNTGHWGGFEAYLPHLYAMAYNTALQSFLPPPAPLYYYKLSAVDVPSASEPSLPATILAAVPQIRQPSPGNCEHAFDMQDEDRDFLPQFR
jgi:hypothetical protein